MENWIGKVNGYMENWIGEGVNGKLDRQRVTMR